MVGKWQKVPFIFNLFFFIKNVIKINDSLSLSGLKKVMWPIYMGLQVLKSVLFAMFLPTIISSVSRLIGKGKCGT